MLLDPKLKSPLKEKFVQNLVNKISAFLDKGKIVGIQTYDGEAENYNNLYRLNENPSSKNKSLDNCHLDTINTLLKALKQRMPKQLKIYMHEFELNKKEIWRPNNEISNNIKSKLFPMEMVRVSPQAYVILSKNDIEILTPW